MLSWLAPAYSVPPAGVSAPPFFRYWFYLLNSKALGEDALNNRHGKRVREVLHNPRGKGAWGRGLQGVTRKPLSYGPSPNHIGADGKP